MLKSIFGLKEKRGFEVGKNKSEGLSIKGWVNLKLYDDLGNLKDEKEGSNTVTTLGHYMAAAQLLAVPGIVTPGWVEVGTGSGQDAADSTLATFIAGSRTAFTTKTRTNKVVTMTFTLAAGVGTGAITEAGIFNVVTENTTDLLFYDDFAVVNKLAGDSLAITWAITYA